MYDYSRLRGRIREKLGSESKLGELLGIDKSTISYKLNGKREFRMSEISIISNILEISPEEYYSYFFTKKVEKSSTS